MARTGGVAMVTFVPGFISGGGPVRAGATAASCERRLVPLRARFAAGDYSMLHEWDSLVTAAGADGLATIADVVATIDHVVKVAGVDHVGIGSDFGAIDALPVGLASAADFPFITYLLVRRGYSAEDVRKILGGNFMRVFRSLNR